jgi:hypothetical protein
MTQVAHDTTDRAVSRSVSMPESVWQVAEGHAKESHGENVSAYIRRLVMADLEDKGLLTKPEDPRQMVMPALDEAIAARGADHIRALLEAAIRREVLP